MDSVIKRQNHFKGACHPSPSCAGTEGKAEMSGGKRRRWSMKSERELIELAKSQSLEAIADKMQRSPASVLKQAARLGLSIKRRAKGK
jgi:hypothetical protein